MKQTTFYPSIWSMIPLNLGWATNYDANGHVIKELILKNPKADTLAVSEMYLNITKFSAMDDKGHEHDIMDFPGQGAVHIKGMSSGHFIRSTSVVSLPAGNYTSLRFYLGRKDNRFTYSDGEQEWANNYGFLDFEIQNGLVLDGGEAAEVKLWFEFTPFQFSRHFKKLKNWFNVKHNHKRRWVEA